MSSILDVYSYLRNTDTVLVMEAGPASRAPSPDVEDSDDDIQAALADIASKRETKGKGKGNAGPPTPTPSPPIPLPKGDEEEDDETWQEAELQRLFAIARRENAYEALRRRNKKNYNSLHGRPASPVLTVDTSPSAALQQPADAPAPANRRRAISPLTLFNDPRYPWFERPNESHLSRGPVADKDSIYNNHGYDDRWLAAAYVTDMAAMASPAMFKMAQKMVRGPRYVYVPQPRQIFVGGPQPGGVGFTAGSPVPTEVDSDDDGRKDASPVPTDVDSDDEDTVVHDYPAHASDYAYAGAGGDTDEDEGAAVPGVDNADEEAAAPVAPPATPVDNSRRLRREAMVMFSRIRKAPPSGSSTKPAACGDTDEDEDVQATVGIDANEDAAGPAGDDADVGADEIMAAPLAPTVAPGNHQVDNVRRLRREPMVMFSPIRKTPTSPSSSGGSTEPAMSPSRDPNSSLNGIGTVSLANRSQNLAALFNQNDGDDGDDNENGDKPDDNADSPSRGWHSSDFSMPSEDSSSPPPSPGAAPSRKRVRQMGRELTSMTDEMGYLRRRIEDMEFITWMAEEKTAKLERRVAKFRRQRKVLEKYYLPYIAKDERLSNGMRQWMPQMEGDELLDWFFKREQSPDVSDGDIVEADSEEDEDDQEDDQEDDAEGSSSSPVAGPSNTSDAPGVGHLSFMSVEEYVFLLNVCGPPS